MAGSMHSGRATEWLPQLEEEAEEEEEEEEEEDLMDSDDGEIQPAEFWHPA